MLSKKSLIVFGIVCKSFGRRCIITTPAFFRRGIKKIAKKVRRRRRMPTTITADIDEDTRNFLEMNMDGTCNAYAKTREMTKGTNQRPIT
jgi:hypothetical protein